MNLGKGSFHSLPADWIHRVNVNDRRVKLGFGINLPLDPQKNRIACPIMGQTQIVIQADLSYQASFEEGDGFLGRIDEVPTLGSRPCVIQVDFHFGFTNAAREAGSNFLG